MSTTNEELLTKLRNDADQAVAVSKLAEKLAERGVDPTIAMRDAVAPHLASAPDDAALDAIAAAIVENRPLPEPRATSTFYDEIREEARRRGAQEKGLSLQARLGMSSG
jgi:hypothetical protein